MDIMASILNAVSPDVVEHYENYASYLWGNAILMTFVIILLGYGIGRLKIKGIGLGSSGVLLVAIVFGHFGLIVPTMVKDLGLVLFVTAVGFIAGPTFFRNFKKNAISFVLLGLIITLLGAGTCVAIKYISGLPTDIVIGMMVGSLTSTPGLAAAVEATGGILSQASIGYGIAYPFGVISVVLFVQLVPKILKTDLAKEREQFRAVIENAEAIPVESKKRFKIDSIGYFAFALAIVIGMLLASIVIPLPGGGKFSLGSTGGPLIAGLVLGHFGRIGPVEMAMNKTSLEPLRELGLILFLCGAGVDAGAGFIAAIAEHGVQLFFWGIPMALVPMIGGFILAKYAFKLNTLNSLGAITGGMTSTPALGTLIEVSGSDDVASAYAATYPIALVSIVLAAQFIGMIP